MSKAGRIRPRHREAIIRSLRAGVVPRTGQQHIQVGRVNEVKALLHDLESIRDGGSSIRFIIGEYGSGKTFFLHLIRSIALEQQLITCHADLTPDRRLHGSGGQARALFAELMRNLATRAKPDGGAMASVVERFVSTALGEARQRGIPPEPVIHERLEELTQMVGGYDFAEVIAAYWRGHDTGDEVLKSAAVRWLRGEIATKTDARASLGVRTIVDDASIYDQLKLMARFARLSGFQGLLVCLDELVNVYKLSHTSSRNANYEQLLRIVNDSLQGIAVGLGLILGGTPDFLLDTRRGVYSYQALQTRLTQNTFAKDGLIDLSGPVINLANLSSEELYVLLDKIRLVYASGDRSALLVPDEALRAFMDHCFHKIGEAYFRTPRTTITAFVNLLAVLEQNPQASWRSLLGDVELAVDRNPELEPLESDEGSGGPRVNEQGDDDDELTAFRL